jgi:simple sugar transport system ATP-binding protein
VGVAAPPALEVRGVTKRFGDVLANEDVDFRIERGRVHALLGENGAGKSTLVNIIFGLYQADTGEVRRNGEVVNLNGPRDAIAQQIGMVHQHFQLVPVLSVAENVVLGDEPTRHGVVDLGEAAAVVQRLSERFGLDIDPQSIVEDLPIGIQQRVEILRALYREVDILILDEPTAVLTPQETGHLLEVLRGLADTGVAVVFITHKLREVMAVADEITVMRRGRVVGHTVPADTDESDLASMMVGRPVELRLKRTPASPGDKMLAIVDLVVNDDRQTQALNGINLDVRAGEVVGVAGVEGNGQRELVEAVTGLRGVISGSIILDGEEIAGRPPRQISTMGVAHIPEDREKLGLIGAHTVADNMVLNRYHHRPYSRHGIRRPAAVDDEATRLVEEFDVRPPNIAAMVATLSGGNKQKVVAAREFSHESKVMVAAQPTRGIDIGNIEFIHRRLIEYRDAGMAILLVSAELDEVLGVSDRVAVIYGGRIVSCEPAEGIDRDRVGRLMLSGADG